MKSILNTGCTWWCKARFWAGHIFLHPRYAAVITAVQRVSSWTLTWSSFLDHNFTQYFAEIGLDYLGYNQTKGVSFRRRKEEKDTRVLLAFGRRRIFWSSQDEARHLIRCPRRKVMAGKMPCHLKSFMNIYSYIYITKGRGERKILNNFSVMKV